MNASLNAHPRDHVARASARLGEPAVARWAAGLLDGSISVDDPSRPPLTLLVGGAARWALDHDDLEGHDLDYWPRVWGARALLYVWTPAAAAAVRAGLDDPAWRVREMSAKVARLRELAEAGDRLVELVTDETPRVRLAAVRALGRVGEGEHARAVAGARADAEPGVRAAAERAVAELTARIDRSIDDLLEDWA